jgi:Concanavalin A-like lectin/glucanases superfamily
MRRPLVAALCAAVAATGVASSAHAALAAAPSPRTTALSPPAAASARARSTGGEFPVAADTTEYATTVANPDGSFTVTSSTRPQRVRRAGGWVAVDPTLHRGADGSVVPGATTSPLAFSGGGAGPLVTLTSADGAQRLALSWPAPLPVPTLSGDTATYASVLPGVDLALTAAADGSFTDVLVVRDRTAAANPDLRAIRLGAAAQGVTLSASGAGALTAVDGRGETVFAASPPQMWDSAVPAARPDGMPAAGSASGVHGPGRTAKRAVMGLSADAAGITITPDPAALVGPDVAYPVYVDPGVTGSFSGWVENKTGPSGWSGQNFFNPGGDAQIGLSGNLEGCAPCFTARSDFQVNIPSQIWGTRVTQAFLQTTEQWSADGTAHNIDAYQTCAISHSMTWNNQCLGAKLTTTSAPGDWRSNGTTNAVGVSFDVTSSAVNAAGNSWHTDAIELINSAEGNDHAWRQFSPSANMAITYWSYPSVPTNPAITVGGATVACSTNAAAPTWVSRTDSGTVALSVAASTPDVGFALWADYYIGIDTSTLTVYPRESPHNAAQPGNNTLTLTGYPVADGSTYAWAAHSSNGTVDSGHNVSGAGLSPPCYFRVDATSPAAGTPSSTDFPANGGGTKTQNQAGTFTLTGADGGVNPSGINHYAYELGSSFTLAGSSSATIAGTAAGAPSGRWQLADAACTGAADSTGGHSGTATGGVTCGAVTDSQHVGRRAFSFNGADAAITAGNVVNTAGSYSVAAWVDLTSAGGWNTAVAQAGSQASGFYLQYSAADNRWALSLTNADVAGAATVRALSTAPPQLGAWTHLVGTYNAANGAMTLYVDGQAQGTATDTTPFATAGALLIGRSQYNATPADWFHGAISDVQTYARVLTTAEVGAIYATTTISVTPPAWGVNTLWSAAVDSAGNVSTPMPYSFFTPAPAFTPGVTGDITGDGRPDLLAVDNAGNLRVYPDPQPSNVSTGGGGGDTLGYGGSILIPGNSTTLNPLWQQATLSGALFAHGGSFIGKNADDVVMLQRHSDGTAGLMVDENVNANGSAWTLVTGIAKPACAVPAGYTFATCAGEHYGAGWSAVRQMIDVPPATASGRPGLLTVEESGGTWGLYSYAPAATGVGFASATLLSASDGAWDWGRMQLLYAGDATGDGSPDLLVREDTGNLGFFGNVLAGINGDPFAARLLIAGVNGQYTADAYPYLASDQAVYNGDPALWAVAADGTLTEVPVVPGSTQPTLGTPTTISAAGWGKHVQALENNYAPYDNVGYVNDGTTYTNARSFDGYGGTYSLQALQTGFTPGSGTAAIYTDMTGTTTATGVSADTVIQAADGAVFTWPSRVSNAPSNYAASGQTIPAPLDQSGTPGAVFPVTRPVTRLSLLGSATGNVAGLSGTAMVTWSDGTTQAVTITLSDWILGGPTPQPVSPANADMGQIPYQVLVSGATKADTPHLFEDTITLTPPSNNVQLASITLPPAVSGQAIHVFATAAQTP